MSGDSKILSKTRVIDVETLPQEFQIQRPLSDNEVEELIVRAKNSLEFIGEETNEINNTKFKCVVDSALGSTNLSVDNSIQPITIEKKLKSMKKKNSWPVVDFRPTEKNFNKKESLPSSVFNGIQVEDIKFPMLKWVEIEEKPQIYIRNDDETKYQVGKHLNEKQGNYFEALIESGQKSKPISKNFRKKDVIGDNANSTYYIEDSELAYELLGRAEYSKYLQTRPEVDDITHLLVESGGFAEFVEVEPQIPCMDLSFLKNTAPMRYTDVTDETPDDNKNINCIFKRENDFKQKLLKEKKPFDKKYEKIDNHSYTQMQSKTVGNGKMPTARSPRPKYGKQSNGYPSPEKRLVRNQEKYLKIQREKVRSIAAGCIIGRSKAKVKNLLVSKSIEELKLEKMTLFAKMANTQERIVENMDKLKLSLLEIYVPESVYEKHKRQKNAFEFTVRFSRNFLYPLKGMIENLKSTSIEHLNSASSNVACNRVASLYILINQSLQTYHRQLRYFMLDQVPQKLSPLIELAYQTTNICLEKGVFDKNDPIVERLQERCEKFIGFLEDMHKERFISTHENFRSMHIDKGHTNYNLKMFMNDSNMYEPKLVPKVRNSYQGQHRKLNEKKKNINVVPVHQNGSETVFRKFGDDEIPTHVQMIEQVDSSNGEGLLSSPHISKNHLNVDELNDGKETINKAIIEALQAVTKEQVRQVLEPIINTLSTVLEKKTFLEVRKRTDDK